MFLCTMKNKFLKSLNLSKYYKFCAKIHIQMRTRHILVLPTYFLERQDAMVLWYNSSCIKTEGRGFESFTAQSFSIQINKYSPHGSQSRRRREHSYSTCQSGQQQSEKKRRWEEKEKKQLHQWKHQSYERGAISQFCVILTSC